MTFPLLSGSRFKQQRLPAWQPILTPPYVAIGFIIVAVVFVPLGGVIIAANNSTKEVSFRYDDVSQCTAAKNMGSFAYDDGTGGTYVTGCITEITFNVTETMRAPVYLYYGLTNFYQNHRRYSSSRNDAQIGGGDVRASSLSDCEPLSRPGDVNGMQGTRITYFGRNLTYGDFVYNPAGLMPWSMFNDSFILFKQASVDGEKIPEADGLVCNGTDFLKSTNDPAAGSITANHCTKKGIAWDTDVARKFKAPPFRVSEQIWTADRVSHYGQPPRDDLGQPISNDTFFNNGWYVGEIGHEVPVLTDEDFMVWMRVASLPHFRKLYRVINVDLTPGKYRMQIHEHFDVSSFGGTKGFTLATVSWVGGRNTFLGAMYLAVGAACVVFSAIFFGVYMAFGDRSQLAIEQLLQK